MPSLSASSAQLCGKVVHIWLLESTGPGLAKTEVFGGVRGQVARAASKTSARNLAAKNCGVEGPKFWLDPNLSRCSLVRTKGPQALILRDYTPG